MKYNQRITWTYSHALNSTARTPVTKRGIFIREVRGGKALVRFDGNKTESRVPMAELQLEVPGNTLGL